MPHLGIRRQRPATERRDGADVDAFRVLELRAAEAHFEDQDFAGAERAAARCAENDSRCLSRHGRKGG
jgi:hypothetical protein